MEIKYQSGFLNQFETEAIVGALPYGRNSPQKLPLGLYAEQLNGSAFTCPRENNLRTWMYRIAPSVLLTEYTQLKDKKYKITPEIKQHLTPTPTRWDPLPFKSDSCDFVQGLVPWVTNGSLESFAGGATYLYTANKSMGDSFFYSADGEFLIVPEQGGMLLKTEFGVLQLAPKEIAVIPRGVKFQVALDNSNNIRGYVCENFGAPFKLPNLGPIGANGLANPRDFQYPVAAFNDQQGDFQLIAKYQGQLFTTILKSHPLDVVAWHGNYAPYKYNLELFNTINTVSFDHPDPSIFTVLTSQTDTSGVANLDFVIFPSRWMVAENTFRPPYYHRNIMSEFMGLIEGNYDAKGEGFYPGGCSLHNCMSPHGPDAEAFENASNANLEPTQLKDTLAFMFESKLPWKISDYAFKSTTLQKNYLSCWHDLPRLFNPA